MNDPQASIHEIAPDTYRISVPLPPSVFPGGFSFNQYWSTIGLCCSTLAPENVGWCANRSRNDAGFDLRYIAFALRGGMRIAGGLRARAICQPCAQWAANVSVGDVVDVRRST
jgi:hypothetical protein